MSRGGSIGLWSLISITSDRGQDPDPDPHQSEMSDPGPHQREKADLDPYQGEAPDAGPQHKIRRSTLYVILRI